MLADDTALEDVVFRQGLLDALPKGGIHVCAGTHGIPVIRKIKGAHADKGHALVAAPMMGRPELVTAGTAGVFASGPAAAMAKCKPLFEALGRKTFEGGADPEAATAMKIANNFVLGCAMEAMGEGFALTRKYGVDTSVFYDVMTDGLFNCSAYKVYGKIMVDESYSKVGQMAVLGLKDANLALEAGHIAAVPSAERKRLARPSDRRGRPRRRRQGLGGDGARAGARERARLSPQADDGTGGACSGVRSEPARPRLS